jgi:hypothetical protein
MDNHWLVLILIGLAASFMPLQFGTEIFLLNGDDGLKKTSSLVGGITLFRMLVAVVTALLFAGASAAALRQSISGVPDFVQSMLSQFHQDVSSGQYVFLDLLLVIAGVVLLIHSYRHFRGRSEATQSTNKVISKVQGINAGELLIFGLTWTAVSVNQWIFTITGVSHILEMPVHPVGRLLAFFLYLLVASLMIFLPISLFFIRPKQARTDLEKVNKWLNGTLGYVVLAGLFVIGLYLIWRGAVGLGHFLAG